MKIILVDDHNLMMFGLRNILGTVPEFEVVGEATNGLEAIELFSKISADVILMDINMPELNGIETTKKIKAINEDIKIIMLTTHDEEQYVLKADMAGADGYLFKNCEKEELIEAIESVHNGVKYYAKSISKDIIEKIQQKSYIKDILDSEITKREIDIIKAIAEGLNNKEIAAKLFISDRTVNTHRTNIMQKLNAKNSVDIVVKALEKKLI